MVKKVGGPSLAVDGVVIKGNSILLVRRKNEPFRNKYALPGGFVECGERTEEAAVREVQEETGCSTRVLQLVGVYSAPGRDPRGHVVSVAYLMECLSGSPHAGSDASESRFLDLDSLPELAFDHRDIVADALWIIKRKRGYGIDE
jgi:8-oxo-dGTP diphosphatase